MRLPYVDEGYVDEDTETFFFGMFSRKKKQGPEANENQGREGEGEGAKNNRKK